MPDLTPRELASRLALIISLFSAIIGGICWAFYLPFTFLFPLGLFIGTFILSYLVLLWGIKQFIEKKFSLIYKTIHHLKIGLKEDVKKIATNEDVFGKIREEVIEWDRTNRQEIERLTDQEKYRREFLGNVFS